MITIEHEKNTVQVSVFNEFTLSDYKQFEENVLYAIRFSGKVNLFFDLRDMVSYTLDMVWEEVKFSQAHAHEFGKVAVLTSEEWQTWAAWVSRLFIETEVQVFSEETAAQAWLNA